MKFFSGVLVILLLIISSFSCSDEQIISPLLYPIKESTEGVKSKVKYLKYNEPGEFILNIEDYEYDSTGLTNRINYYNGDRENFISYELFNYDTERKLITKYNYHANINSPTGFILFDSTCYTYQGHQLIVETRRLTLSNFKYSYEYEYKDNFLYKMKYYENNELVSYTIFNYLDNKLFEEIKYISTGDRISSKTFLFKGSLLVQSIFYDSRKDAVRKFTYSYNEYGKLVSEKVEEFNIFHSLSNYTILYLY